MKVGSRFFRRAFLLGLAVRAILFLVVVVCAASISITPTSLSGEMGTQLTVANGLRLMDKGFMTTSLPLSAAGISCLSPIVFGSSPGMANTAVTANDAVYDVQVNTTATAPPNTCFTVRLVTTNGSGSQTSYGPVNIETGSSITAGQTIDCKFDLQTSNLPASPFSFKVTVQ